MSKVLLFAGALVCLLAMAAPCSAAASTSAPSPATVSSTSSSVGQPEQLTTQEMEETTGEWVSIYRGSWFGCQYQLFANAGKYNGMWIVQISWWTYELRGNPKWSL